MKTRCITAAFIFLVIAGDRLAAAPAVSKPSAVKTNPRLNPMGKGWRLERASVLDPKLPRVLLIGDSVLNGYLPLRHQDEGKANVDASINPYWQSESTDKLLAEVLDNGPYDVVYFNIGLHRLVKGRFRKGNTSR